MPTSRPAFPTTFTYATVTFFLVVAAFAFTWYSLRPTFFVGLCNDDASASARNLLKAKAGAMGDPALRGEYLRLADADLYLQPDYEFFFRTCMREHGFDR